MDDVNNNDQRHSPPKLPPKSRFNDEESTAVLRLLIKQEKLLKNKDENPALRLTPEKSGRHLPAVMADQREGQRRKEMMTTQEDLTYYKQLPVCTSSERSAFAGGIYQSPKLARAKDRPKGSYGRRQQQQEQQKQQQQKPESIPRPESRLQGRDRTFSYEETTTNLKEQTLKLGSKTSLSRTRSCPVSSYQTHIPPISPKNHPMTSWVNSTSTFPRSFNKSDLKSGPFQS
jgi:hypothetical protein